MAKSRVEERKREIRWVRELGRGQISYSAADTVGELHSGPIINGQNSFQEVKWKQKGHLGGDCSGPSERWQRLSLGSN